jgi:PEP-CTERM motif
VRPDRTAVLGRLVGRATRRRSLRAWRTAPGAWMAVALAAIGLTHNKAGAQGVVDFNMLAPNVILPPITDGRTGAALEGPDWLAQLYFAPAWSAPELSLAPVGLALPFRSDGGRGFVNIGPDPASGIRFLPGTQEGDPVTLQVRAWNVAAGATYEAAAASPEGVVGESPPWNSEAGSLQSPTYLRGMQPFSVEPVPEPSALATFGIGLTLLAARRRRPKCPATRNVRDDCR